MLEMKCHDKKLETFNILLISNETQQILIASIHSSFETN